MKEYKTLKELKEDYYTLSDLYRFLLLEGYSGNKKTVQRWEKFKIISVAKRVPLKSYLYRVYSKDGSDFKTILKSLKKRTKKRIILNS